MSGSKGKKKVTFKVGDWVEVAQTNIFRDTKKGQLGVINEINGAAGSSYVAVLFQDQFGETHNKTVDKDELKKVNAPQFVVAWSTKQEDPVCYFNNLASAKAFAKKVKSRTSFRKGIESGVYKRIK